VREFFFLRFVTVTKPYSDSLSKAKQKRSPRNLALVNLDHAHRQKGSACQAVEFYEPFVHRIQLDRVPFFTEEHHTILTFEAMGKAAVMANVSQR
jgi:hypothetical protein